MTIHSGTTANKQELNADFIGGAGPLTKEEKEISEFIRAGKERLAKQRIRKERNTNRQKGVTKSGA